MAKLTDKEVQTILQSERNDALGGMESAKLSEDRATALDFYLGDMSTHLTAPADRSQAVDSTLMDTIEGLMPSLMEIFCSGDEVVEFTPQGPEDEELAEQETDYINHVFMQKNPGFIILYTMIKDALLSKNAVVKVFWDEREEEDKKTFFGLTEAEYGMLLMEEEKDKLKVVEHTERVGLPGQPPEEEGAYV